MAQLTTVESAFAVYDNQLGRVADHIGAITPALGQNRAAVPVFVESMMVVLVARFEHFLKSLVAGAVRQRESAARDHFSEYGSDGQRRIAQSCDLGTLIRMAKRRISFREGGKSIEGIFRVLFGFSPWPSADAFRLVSDLVLLRNIFVHEGDSVLAEHATQFYRKDLFTSRSYGEFTVYSVEYSNALVFLREAIVGLKAQSEHVRRELLSRPEWTYRSPVAADSEEESV